jgi:WD40 repeat protein
MGTLSVYNQSKTLQQSFQAHYKEITRIKFLAQNSSLAATVSCDSTVNIWNTSFNPWTLTASFAGSGDCFVGLAFIDADTVAMGDVGGLIQKWSIKTGQTLNSLSSGKGVFSLQLFTNNQGVTCLAAGLDSPGDINIYNLNTFTFITSLVGHSETVFDLALVSTSNLLVSSSMDLTIRLWDLTTNTCKFILQGHTSNVYGLKVISSNVLASGSDDRTIKLWSINDGSLIRTLTGHTGTIVWSLDLYDSQTLVSGSYDQTIKFWDWQTGECLSTLETEFDINTLAVSSSNCKQIKDFLQGGKRSIMQRIKFSLRL